MITTVYNITYDSLLLYKVLLEILSYIITLNLIRGYCSYSQVDSPVKVWINNFFKVQVYLTASCAVHRRRKKKPHFRFKKKSDFSNWPFCCIINFLPPIRVVNKKVLRSTAFKTWPTIKLLSYPFFSYSSFRRGIK